MIAEEPPKKRYVSIHEVVVNPQFIEAVKSRIEKLKTQRKLRPLPKQGYHYKRDFFDRMMDENQLRSEFFINEFPLILGKKSQLSSERRHIINYICESAFMDILPKPTLNAETV